MTTAFVEAGSLFCQRGRVGGARINPECVGCQAGPTTTPPEGQGRRHRHRFRLQGNVRLLSRHPEDYSTRNPF